MQDLLTTILGAVRGAWRFRRFALIAAWIFACLGWAAVFAMPDMFQANSRVFVDTKTALKPVIKDIAIDQDVNAQLNSVRQSLLSQPQLEPVAVKVGLVDRRTMDAQQIAKVLARLREKIEITVHNASDNPNDREAGNIYSIQYTDTKRERALLVVETLQQDLIENTIGGKRQGTEDARKFLDEQIREYEQRLGAAEDRLANFKKNNVGLMPTEQGGYFQRLQLEMDAVQKSQTSLSVATSRRDELSRQLRGDVAITATAIPTTQNGVAAGDTMSQIKATQARLDDLLLRFTEKHPDVVAARENLEQLRKRREAEIKALRAGDPDAIANSSVSANPVYQNIQLQLNQADVEIATLRRELAGHQTNVAQLRQNLDTMPQVEAEFARLNRDYDVTKANYNELLERKDKSRLGEVAADNGSVRFDVVEPPNAAFTPVSPMRSLFIVTVLLAAIGAGAAVAFLLHQLRPIFTSARDLAAATGLTVLGGVSSAWIENQKRIRRNSYIRYAVAVAALFALSVVVLQMSRNGIRLPMKG